MCWSGQVVEVDCTDAPTLTAALRDSVVHREAGAEVHLKLRGHIKLDRPLAIPVQPSSARSGRVTWPQLILRGPAIVDGGVSVINWTRDARRPWLYSAPVPVELSLPDNESITQLWDGEQRIPPARTPILHYSHLGALNTTSGLARSVVFNSTRGIPSDFMPTTGVRLFLYHAWDISYHPVVNLRRSGGKPPGVELAVGNFIKTSWGVGAGAPGYRCFIEGHESFLREGSATFVHDVGAGRLLYAPADGKAPGQATTVPRLPELLRSDGASAVTLQDLTFQHSAVDFSRCLSSASFCEMQSAADQAVAALHWTNSELVVLRNITIQHTGGYGLWFDSGTRDAVVNEAHLHDLGAGGVRMSMAHNITVEDSVIENGGHVWRQAVGVLMQSANRSVVAHNSISRFFYTGTYASTLLLHLSCSDARIN
jgi:hypothetical protein